MMHRSPLAAWLLLSSLALPALAGTSETDHDADADFSSYRTYSWREVEPAGDDERIARSDLVVKRARAVIEGQLRKKGLTEAASADLLIEFRVQVRERVDLDATGSRRGTSGLFLNNVNAGTAIVDLIDRRRDALVWRGWSHELIRDGRTAESRIRRGIEKLFRDYPPDKRASD